MQGIYKGFRVDAHDIAWSCALDLVQDYKGVSNGNAAYELIKMSGSAYIRKE